MANGLRVRMLGPLDVSCRGMAVGPGGARRRSLFAMLALRANELCGLDSIVDGLWGPKPPASATGVVQTYVSTWRKALDDDGTAGVERLAPRGHVGLDDTRRARRRLGAPQAVDERVQTAQLVGPQGEQREQRPPSRPTRTDGHAPAGDVQRTQHTYPQVVRHPRSLTARRAWSHPVQRRDSRIGAAFERRTGASSPSRSPRPETRRKP